MLVNIQCNLAIFKGLRIVFQFYQTHRSIYEYLRVAWQYVYLKKGWVVRGYGDCACILTQIICKILDGVLVLSLLEILNPVIAMLLGLHRFFEFHRISASHGEIACGGSLGVLDWQLVIMPVLRWLRHRRIIIIGLLIRLQWRIHWWWSEIPLRLEWEGSRLNRSLKSIHILLLVLNGATASIIRLIWILVLLIHWLIRRRHPADPRLSIIGARLLPLRLPIVKLPALYLIIHLAF